MRTFLTPFTYARQAGLIASLFFASFSGIAQTTIAGTTPGQFEVNSGGSTNYRIPIQVPPGVAGMQPKLELVYNSGSGNGFVGMGWGLAGLSTITRCPQTMGTDGARSTVKFNNTDRFCMDGQRLMLTAGASYGVAASQYRTERETFTQVTANGGDNTTNSTYTGPQSFIVKTKDGLTLEYGNSTDSRIEVPNKSAIFSWAINKITDAKGNYLTVTYIEDNPKGAYYPSRIDYAGNATAGTVPTMSVRFAYEAKPDTRTMYMAGVAFKQDQRLKNIQTYLGATLVRDYRLAYLAANVVPNSTLSTLTECQGASSCFAPKTFVHDVVDNKLGVTTINAPVSWTSGIWLDYNGDGRMDFCNPSLFLCTLSSGGSFASPIVLVLPSNWSGFTWPDLNGDGILDVCARVVNSLRGEVVSSSNQCAFSSGGGSFSAPTWLQEVAGAPSGLGTGYRWDYAADVNGDGIDEICGSSLTNKETKDGGFVIAKPACRFSTGVLLNNQALADEADEAVMRWIDANGDSMADYCRVSSVVNGNTPSCTLSTGSSMGGGTISGASLGTDLPEGKAWVDVNADGLIDYCRVLTNNTVQCTLNTGTAFAGTLTSGTLDLGVAATRQWADVNGDGMADFCRQLTSDKLACTLSKGDGFGVTLESAAVGKGSWQKWVDANGDGYLDYCQILLNGTPSCATSLFMDSRIDKIQDNVANSISISYQSLAASAAIHSQESASYPQISKQVAHYAVATVSRSDGLGGVVVTQYSYGGLKKDAASDRGMLGFRWLKAKQTATGLETYTEYRQDWPYVGQVSKEELRLAGAGSAGVLKRSTNTLACKHPNNASACSVAAGARYFPFVNGRVEEAWDINGAAIPTSTTTISYATDIDGSMYGDVASTTVSTSDGFAKTTTNEYKPADTANWIVGRLKKSTVNSTAPDGSLVVNTGGTPALALAVTPPSVMQVQPTAGVMSATFVPATTGGFPGYTYLWERVGAGVLAMNADGSGKLIVSASVVANQTIVEKFRVTVTDQSGAQSSAEVQATLAVVVPPPIAITVTPLAAAVEQSSSAGKASSTATATVTGGFGSYTYSWSRLVGTRTVIANATTLNPTFTANVALGENFTETMRLTVTDQLGASAYKDITVRYYAAAPVSAGFANTKKWTGDLGCTGLVIADASTPVMSVAANPAGGYPPYTYQWTVSFPKLVSVTPSANTVSIKFAGPNSPQETAYGTTQKSYPYQVKVTDSRGNVANASGSFTSQTYCLREGSK